MPPYAGDIDIEGRQYTSRNEKAVGEIKVTSNNNSNILIKGGYLGRKQATKRPPSMHLSFFVIYTIQNHLHPLFLHSQDNDPSRKKR